MPLRIIQGHEVVGLRMPRAFRCVEGQLRRLRACVPSQRDADLSSWPSEECRPWSLDPIHGMKIEIDWTHPLTALHAELLEFARRIERLDPSDESNLIQLVHDGAGFLNRFVEAVQRTEARIVPFERRSCGGEGCLEVPTRDCLMCGKHRCYACYRDEPECDLCESLFLFFL